MNLEGKNKPTILVLQRIVLLSVSLIFSTFVVSGNKILLLPFVCLFAYFWGNFALRWPAIAICIIVFFAEDCFDIATFGIRQRLLSDIAIILLAIPIMMRWKRVWYHVVVQKAPYALAILAYFLVIINANYFGAYQTFGQPFLIGMVTARKYLLFFSYFFLVASGAQKEDCFTVMRYLCYLGAFIAFLSLIESILGGGVIFSHYYAIGQERGGLLRVHVGVFLIVFSVIYSAVMVQQSMLKSNRRAVYWVILALGCLVLISVVMTRAVLLIVFIVLAVIFFKKINYRKIIVFSFSVVLCGFLFVSGLLSSMYSGSFLEEVAEQTVSEVSGNQGNVGVRTRSAEFYLKLVKDNAPITGVGLFSDTNFPMNPFAIAGNDYGYFIVDINGIATIVFFGLSGAVLLLYLNIKLFSDVFKLLNTSTQRDRPYYSILGLIFLYILLTPTVNNLLVESMLVYSGGFLFLVNKSVTSYPFKKTKKLP